MGYRTKSEEGCWCKHCGDTIGVMAELDLDSHENSLVHTLPYETMRDLNRVLDGGEAWVELVSESHHYLEEYALSTENVDVPSSSQNYQQYSRGQHSHDWCILKASISSVKRSEPQQASHAASGTTQKSSTALTTTDTASSGNISDPIWSALQNTLAVPYTELLTATSNFAESNVLGKGGYGVVYVGEWKHTKIAVKRFMTSGNKGSHIQRERLRQSLQELRTLAKYRHDNILPLYAFSLEGPEPCLVYQFMSNGSLEDRLLCRRGTPPLSWLQKKEIAEGSARGLHFLHCIASTPIIHGDVKSANILLDRHFEPKLGDFGLSRDGKVETDAQEQSPLIASHVKGTLAYLPPEFITNKILSTKLDVYSFGIVLLEITTGLRAYMDSRSPPGLAEYCVCTKSSRKGDWIEALMDRRTPHVSNEVFILFNLVCKCSSKHYSFNCGMSSLLSSKAN
ncbi:kinase domain protein [Ancylostoma ceylanicum]|uniref:non-specific serine/threonine protein kinase n=1 Tax=Ancylostoma ceylanicum TaxID=53326 RepID=A0A0D6LID2_9BILA|nr:kinase domain protein [Ancylostoma ceylanicum]